MRRLLLATIGLMALCTAAIVAVMIAGGRLNPDWTPDLDAINRCSDGLLCAFGMIPGVTTGQEATFRLTEIGTYALENNLSHYQVGDMQVSYFLETANNENSKITKFGISWDPDESPVAIGAFLAKFGAPCGISLGDNGKIGFVYQHFGFLTEENIFAFTLTNSDKVIYVRAESDLSHGDAGLTRCTHNVNWQGLGSITKYIKGDAALYGASIP